MRRVLTMAAVIFIGCSTSFAQVGPTPGMGATSPVGSMNSNASSELGGIPLGATELNIGGVSPIASTTPCYGTATTSTGMAGSSSTFDGGGSTSSSTIRTACGSTASGSSLGAAATPAPAGLAPGSTSSGNIIPLGATELSTPGESQMVTLPVPSVSATHCPGISTMTGTLGTSGMSSTNGC